jgi:hypothetical protein
VGSLQLSANHNILQIIDVCQEYEKEQKWVDYDLLVKCYKWFNSIFWIFSLLCIDTVIETFLNFIIVNSEKHSVFETVVYVVDF